jgi:hypothetical protein
MISDVMEKVNLEKNLLWSQKIKDLGHMAAGLAHDLNNLFTILPPITTPGSPRTWSPRSSSRSSPAPGAIPG